MQHYSKAWGKHHCRYVHVCVWTSCLVFLQDALTSELETSLATARAEQERQVREFMLSKINRLANFNRVSL